jgi:D-inositol-3-phosphate glycosyltransferase
LDGRAASWLEEVSARRANLVVSTRSNLDEVADAIGLAPRALHAIPYPVRLPELSPMPADAGPRVTFVGRLEPRKGPELVIRAAPAVLREIPDAKFVFVGRDACSPGLPSSSAGLRREAERLGVEGSIELTGQMAPAAVIDQLRAATVGVFPSRWESFGNVVAEASAVGRPVVASPIPPFRELVEDGVSGHLVRSEEPEAWAQSLIEVLKDRERAGAMGRAGATRVAGISAPERVASLALAAYDEAIARWRRGERAGR